MFLTQWLLDAEFHMDRSDEQLKSSYINEESRQFIFGPLEDLGYKEPSPEDFHYSVSSGGNIMKSRTIRAFVKPPDQDEMVQLFYSTKYDKREFEGHLEKKSLKFS